MTPLRLERHGKVLRMALPGWRGVLGCGLALWLASIGALVATDDDILLPSVVLLGSFLTPVTVIFWFVERGGVTALTPQRLLAAFFVAGVAGLLVAAMLETWLLPDRLLPNVWIGLVEEFLKGFGVWVLARGLREYTVRDGVLLGTTVGLGFGAFEAAGYTLSWGMTASGFDLSDMIAEEALRIVVAPFCHGVWTGLFGGVLFACRGRVTWRVVGAYLAAASLHALWDGASTAGIVVTVLASGTSSQRDDLSNGDLPMPSSLDPQWLYGGVQWAMMIAVALLGVIVLRQHWRRNAGP
jgi:RsiW-degrading membrane proteinase PrsW (M82 family)